MVGDSTPVYWDILSKNGKIFYLAATDLGLCRIALPNESFSVLEQWVVRHIFKAHLLQDADKLHRYVEEIEEYLDGKRSVFSLPLDPRGTPFQVAVWQALRAIPYGTTQSYAQIAMAIGNPKAVRAVGAANGANPLPMIVPCHRVIGKNGTLVGYRGGMIMKNELLTLEGVNLSTKHNQELFGS